MVHVPCLHPLVLQRILPKRPTGGWSGALLGSSITFFAPSCCGASVAKFRKQKKEKIDSLNVGNFAALWPPKDVTLKKDPAKPWQIQTHTHRGNWPNQN